MFRQKKILALIPARSGSKGLVRKNIKVLGGLPLVAWTIREALRSRYVDEVVASTDSRTIARICARYGAEAPFLRPRFLATDEAKTIDVILHALNFFEKGGKRFDLVLLLQPTSPFRSCQDINAAIKLFFKKRANSIVSLCPAEHHPLWLNRLPANGRLDNFMAGKFRNKNRQELPEFYEINGALYLADVDFLKKNRSFIGKGSYAYIMPPARSVDIDTALDFKFAEFLLRQKK